MKACKSILLPVSFALSTAAASVFGADATDRTSIPDVCSNRDVNCVLPDAGAPPRPVAAAGAGGTASAATPDAGAGTNTIVVTPSAGLSGGTATQAPVLPNPLSTLGGSTSSAAGTGGSGTAATSSGQASGTASSTSGSGALRGSGTAR